MPRMNFPDTISKENNHFSQENDCKGKIWVENLEKESLKQTNDNEFRLYCAYLSVQPIAWHLAHMMCNI